MNLRRTDPTDLNEARQRLNDHLNAGGKFIASFGLN